MSSNLSAMPRASITDVVLCSDRESIIALEGGMIIADAISKLFTSLPFAELIFSVRLRILICGTSALYS
jgi:hypothetical protein